MTRSRAIEEVILGSDLASTMLVNATADVYSHSKSLGYGVSFAIILLATSAGTVNVDVYVEEGAAAPTTEGSADSNWSIPENTSKLITLDDETIHRIAYSPVVGGYMRLLLDGQTGNDATTTIAAKLVIIEDV